MGDNEAVATAAAISNVHRMRLIAPFVMLLNAVHVGIFYFAWQHNTDPLTARWQWALLVAHVCMGACMLLATWVVRHLPSSGESAMTRAVPVALMALGILFAIAVVMIDQWVTTNITPFLVACLLIGLVGHLRPRTALGLYLTVYLVYFWGMGWVTEQPTILLTNRLNGLTACVVGLSLSVVLWRNFTTITLQQAALERANTALEHLARVDGLTGLYNRTCFVDMAQREVARAQRRGDHTSLLILDLDHFKRINDSRGHPAGDAVLRHVAATLQGAVRKTDMVGRIGGEEFMVLLPNTTASDAHALAEKLRQMVQDSPTPWGTQTLPITMSIGIGTSAGSPTCSYASLYSEADQALYAAKEAGRNRVVGVRH